MKKVLSVLTLFAVLGLTSPVMAAPHGPGGPHGHGGHGGGHHVHAGVSHHRPPVMHHRHHGYHGHRGGVYIHAGYPRHSYWGSYGLGYWGNTWCDYRLGCYDPFFYGPPRPVVPVSTLGLSIRL